jgi:hypothetical protein
MKELHHNVTSVTTQAQMKSAPLLTTAKVVGLALLTCFAVQTGSAAEPTELTASRAQRDKAIGQVQQEAQAKVKRIDEQYVLSLDALMNSFTRAGKLDEALAVRDEKIRVNESLGIKGTAEDGLTKKAATAKPSPHSGRNKIIEGEGWRGFRVGATREELIKELGNPDTDSKGPWFKWKKDSVHCIMDDKLGAVELRFDTGFKGETTSGIEIGSALKKTLAAYGEPTAQEERGSAKKLIWTSKGILIWFNEEGKVSQIVVFPKK